MDFLYPLDPYIKSSFGMGVAALFIAIGLFQLLKANARSQSTGLTSGLVMLGAGALAVLRYFDNGF